jgi:diguanylate cyclase (GGDEF)-like protein
MTPDKNQPLILIADDDPTQLLLTRQTLENEGYRVTAAENGLEALESFKKQQPDMVLLDVMMPEMNGFETCQAIRDLPRNKEIPVLMITGLEDLDSINQAYDSGATDFITKPLNWLILSQRVRYMLRASLAMDKVKRSEELLAHAQTIAKLGNWEWDFHRDEMQWSAEVFRLLAASPSRTTPTMETLLDLIHHDDREAFKEAIKHVRSAREKVELKLRTADNNNEGVRYLDSQIALITNATDNQEPKVLMGTFQDITERQQALEHIHYLSNYDPLTGLPNRKLFTNYLEKAISEAKRGKKILGIMVLNIDRFKRINDSLGSAAGNLLLREISKRLKKSVRLEDNLSRSVPTEKIRLSRRGGDEFSLLFGGRLKANDFSRIARRLQDSLKTSFEIHNQEIFLTASVGISVYPADGNNANTLLKNADAALHHAKKYGPNSCLFYSASMNELAMEQIKLEAHLRTALEKQHFQLYYQPLVSIQQQRIIGAEALIRWQHPEMGLVPPLKFIPLAETTGLINEIGKWVIRTACDQQVSWIKAGRPPIRIAVNISAVQFDDDSFVNTVSDAINKSGIDPQFLELELTESIIINESEKILGTMQQLKNLGVKMVVDDFGTGYSSLRYLKHFPIDGLKIDRSFIKDIPENNDDCALAESIILMAVSLSLSVVAEGIETREQFNFFANHLNGEIQGYLFSPPVPAAEFENLLDSDFFSKVIKKQNNETTNKYR